VRWSVMKEVLRFYRYMLVFENWPLYAMDWLGLIDEGRIINYVLRSGLQFRVRAGTGDRIAINNIWVKNAFMVRLDDVRKCSTVIDVGAHIGAFSIFVASLARHAKVYSYEPEPSNYALLKENIKINGFEGKIRPLNLAVLASRGTAKLYLRDRSISHSTTAAACVGGSTGIEVPCVSLEDIFEDNHLDRCDLLKINAEGAEYPILLNASEEILSRVRILCVQCHEIDDKRNVSVLEKFLVGKDFSLVKKGEFVKAIKK